MDVQVVESERAVGLLMWVSAEMTWIAGYPAGSEAVFFGEAAELLQFMANQDEGLGSEDDFMMGLLVWQYHRVLVGHDFPLCGSRH